ncbi:MAG: hypothetical protein D6677_12860 [Calditrichaeota bacterium]|nr:MAG: hypothetical protein D6677_12860 [Calditrichota bacterium]
MEHSRSRFNPYLVKSAGLFSIIGGLLSLGGLFYILIVLGSYGLTMNMFSQPSSLLPWIYKNSFAYSLLWLHQLLFGVLMVPVPFAGAQLFRQHHSSRSSALATLSYLIGMVGFILIILSALTYFSFSPITARGWVQGQSSALLMHDIFSTLGMQLRLFGMMMISLWLMGIGIHLVRKNKIDMFAWFSFALLIFTFIVSLGKAYGAYDWESFLGILLAFTYIWLGLLMRQKSRA